jgi:hypothetical protein
MAVALATILDWGLWNGCILTTHMLCNWFRLVHARNMSFLMYNRLHSAVSHRLNKEMNIISPEKLHSYFTAVQTTNWCTAMVWSVDFACHNLCHENFLMFAICQGNCAQYSTFKVKFYYVLYLGIYSYLYFVICDPPSSVCNNVLASPINLLAPTRWQIHHNLLFVFAILL